MNKRRFDFRWVLDYGTHQKCGPWSLPVSDEKEKATNQTRVGLRWALIQGRDAGGNLMTFARCPATDYVAFQMKVIARMGVAIGNKGGAVGNPTYQSIGMTLVTQEKIIDVFDTGLVKERNTPEHYSRLTDIGRYVR